MEKLLLITGWAHGTAAFHPLAEKLSSDFSIQLLSAADVLAGQKIPDAEFIAGWSMGGLLAMAQLPAACKKLVLISSTARFCTADGYDCGTPQKTLRSFSTLLRRKPQTVLPEIAGNIYRPHAVPEFPPEDASSLTVLAEGLDYLRETDLREKTVSIQIPVLLLHGTEDSMIPSAASAWLHEQLPDSQLELLPGEGHAVPLQNPTLIADRINCFLNSPQDSG